MTREEMLKRYIVRESETEQAAIGYLDDVFGGGKHQDLYVRLFMAGAQWADQHSKDNLVDIDSACERLESFLYDKLNSGELECGDIEKLIKDGKTALVENNK